MNEKQLEDALHAWPLPEVPGGFSKIVMEQIKPRQSGVRMPQKSELKFRLNWMDYALGIFLSFLPLLGFFTFISLPQKFILYLKYQWLLLRFPAYEPVLFAFTGAFAIVLLLTFLLSLRYLFPGQISLR